MKENLCGLPPATEAEKLAMIPVLERIAGNPEEDDADRIAAARLLDQIKGTAHDGPQEG